MASDDWSLTPATLARVAELPTPDVPDPDALGSDALAALERGARLGVDSCGICGAPETTTGDDDDAGAGDAPPSVECARCRAIVYCGEAHMAADARAHARVCDLLAFDADLADVDVPDADARAAAAVKATVAKLKLLGRRTTATLLGPRGYGDEGDDENEAAARAARDEATKPRWRALFKLARTDDAKPKDDDDDADANAKTAATLRRHAELLSAPLSLVAASWLFPVVKYALMLGVGGEGRAEEDETAAADKELTPAVVHVVHGSGGDWCDAAADAMWLVGYGAALEKPGVEVTVVAPDLPEGWHGVKRSVGGDDRGTRSVSFHRGRYDDFAAAAGGTKAGDDASPASTGPCLVFALDLCEALDECEDGEEDEEGNEGGGGGGGWMRSVRAAGCPVLTANRNQFELAAERERMEDELGYVLVGMARNPFPCPVPRQSPASANEVHRRNEWLAAYVPAPLANPAIDDDDKLRLARGPGKRSAAGDESEGDRGDGGGEKRARR